MTDGKTQRPPGSAEAPLGRSEHIPTPEGRGGEREEAMEAAKRIVASVAEADAMLVARALLSSPRVEEVRRMREALEEWRRLSLVLESAVRNADWPNYQAVLRAINTTKAALSPPVG